jgi:uncharacterized membrane protein YoaK (UPF0700 family)
MKMSFEIFVVLAPAIVCSIVGFVVEALPRILSFIDRKVYSSEKRVEWLSEIFSHASFLGGAVASALGFTNKAPELYGVAAVWFFTQIAVKPRRSGRGYKAKMFGF